MVKEARHGNSTQGKSQESQRDSLSTSLRADAVDAAHQSAIPANEMTEPSPPQTGAISLGPEMSGKSFQLLSKRGSKKARSAHLLNNNVGQIRPGRFFLSSGSIMSTIWVPRSSLLGITAIDVIKFL